MKIQELEGKKIGILGFGVEGKAVASFLHSKDFEFAVFDKKPESAAEAEQFGVKAFTGDDYLSHLAGFDVLFRSPGVKINEPAIQTAKENGAVITSQIKFFLENFQGKVVGITGTKGKSTTAKLIHDILSEAGTKNHLAGNYGMPVFELLKNISADDIVILELSSFQLQDLTVSPHVAVVLMVTSEHLNYHKDTDEYVAAKSAITAFQKKEDFAVINFDYDSSRQIGKLGEGEKKFVQTLSKENLSGDPFEVFDPSKHLKIENGFFAEEIRGASYLVENSEMKKFMEASEVPLKGFHNQQNLGAAVLAALSLGVPVETIKAAVKKFKAPPHRLEFAGEKDEVKYYDDSISTTPESCIASVRAFAEPVVLIAGGDDKKADYEQLAKDLTKMTRLKGVVCVGTIGRRLAEGFRNAGFAGQIAENAKDMGGIIEQARGIAKSGDVILLAPATSSFDMFRDYKDRGDQFKELATK